MCKILIFFLVNLVVKFKVNTKARNQILLNSIELNRIFIQLFCQSTMQCMWQRCLVSLTMFFRQWQFSIHIGPPMYRVRLCVVVSCCDWQSFLLVWLTWWFFPKNLMSCHYMAAKSWECRLCPISMKIYILGWFRVANMMVWLKFSLSRHIFQNGCHIVRMSTLSDFNENWYLGVIWCDEYDSAIKFVFRATIFFHLLCLWCHTVMLC